jgi:hypothetical protein
MMPMTSPALAPAQTVPDDRRTLVQPAEGEQIRINNRPYQVKKDCREPEDGPYDWYFRCIAVEGGKNVQPGNPNGKAPEKLPGTLMVIWRRGPDGEIPHIDDIDNRLSIRNRIKGILNVPEHYEVTVSVESADGQGLREMNLSGAEVRESLGGINLSNWMKEYARRNGQGDRFAGIADPELWFLMAKAFIKALRPLHAERIVHGDLCPRNIVIRSMGSTEDYDAEKHGDWLTKQFFNETGPGTDKCEIFFIETHGTAPQKFHVKEIKKSEDNGNGEPLHQGTFRRKYDSPLIRYVMRKRGSLYLEREDTTEHWFAPTDIFSLGILLFELAFGSEAKLGPFVTEHTVHCWLPKKNEQEKSKPDLELFLIDHYAAQQQIRNLKKSLLRIGKEALARRTGIPDNSGTTKVANAKFLLRASEIIMACLRSHMDVTTVDDLGELERVRRQFDPCEATELETWDLTDADPFDWKAAHQALEAIDTQLEAFVKTRLRGIPAIVRNHVRERCNHFSRQVHRLVGDQELAQFLQERDRSSMIDALVRMINQLEPQDRLVENGKPPAKNGKHKDKTEALLTPAFFLGDNLNYYGRLTCALQLAALRNVEVNWIILLSEPDLASFPVQQILFWQREAYRFLCGLLGSNECNYGVSYAIASKSEYENVLKNHLTSIFLYTQPERNEEQTRLLIAPDYHGERGAVAALRIWPEVEFADTSPVETPLDGRRLIRSRAQGERRDKLIEAFHGFTERKISVCSYHL